MSENEAAVAPTEDMAFERRLIDCLGVRCSGTLELKVIADEKTGSCDVCGEPFAGSVFYQCKSYESPIHDYCAHVPLKIRHPFHPHDLVVGPWYDPEEEPSEKHCQACGSRFPKWKKKLPVYRCQDCPDFLIHMNCAREMPSLKHDGHEHHPLTLLRILEEDVNYNRLQCAWCSDDWYDQEGRQNGLAAYRCVHCDFSLHRSCAKYPKHTTSEEHEEEHKLLYISPSNIETEYRWTHGEYCQACGEDIAEDQPVYKCVTCPGYFFHRHCIVSKSEDLQPREALSLEESLPLFHELCQVLGREDCNAPVPRLLPIDDKISTLQI